MPDMPAESGQSDRMNSCIDISLRSAASLIRASNGREIPFARAVLIMRNICDIEVVSCEPHATLGQEGGTVQDVTGSFSPSVIASIPPGGTVEWDVYDHLIPAHQGTASKIHMFGYRAALNWRFDLEAWAEYRSPGSPIAVRTGVSRWTVRWSVADANTGEVQVSIEKLGN